MAIITIGVHTTPLEKIKVKDMGCKSYCKDCVWFSGDNELGGRLYKCKRTAAQIERAIQDKVLVDKI